MLPSSLNPWIEPLRFACEVQNVVTMRLLLLAQGGPQAAEEAQVMVAEKFAALAAAEIAAAEALLAGKGLMIAAERAYAPVCRRVYDNGDRLAHTLR